MTVSVKSLQKQLIAAIAMVLVAMIALGSSTYAWFAANTSVTAGNVSVSAASDQPYLQISDAAEGTYSTAATLSTGNSASNLKLTIPLNLKGNLVAYKANQAAEDTTKAADGSAAATADAVKWGTAYSSKTNEVQAANVPWNVTASKDEYVLTTHVYVRTAANTTGYNLKMEAPTTVTVGSNSISDALRIVAVAADGKWMMWDKGTGNVTASDTALVASIAKEGASPAYDVITIYMYFDGTDDISMTDNATDLSAITTNLKFTCTETA